MSDLPVGTIVDKRYEVVRIIGKGGMGAVYEATDQRFGSTVALKHMFINSTLSDKKIRQAEYAFKREAKTLHYLRHPSLPRVSDYFTDQPHGHFLVMDYIQGNDLAIWLRNRMKSVGTPFTEQNILPWIIAILKALHYLHQQTPPIIHRDIKPSNIKVTRDGQVYLLDFGISKGMSVDSSLPNTIQAYTLAYAPLEQIRGGQDSQNSQKTEPRSDLFSLGATMYHLLTGSALDREPSRDALTRSNAKINEQPDPLVPIPNVSDHINAIILQALSLNIEQRPASAIAMIDALMGKQTPQTQVLSSEQHTQMTIIVPQQPITSPLFPVTLGEWHNEVSQCNKRFGQPTGYWCYIPPGLYTIGGSKNNTTSCMISLDAFWVARYPITVQQYFLFIQAGGYSNQQYWTPHGWKWQQTYDNGNGRKQPLWWFDERFDDNNQPVAGITWYEAIAFANWLTAELIKVLPNGYRVCVPCEAEWEVACAYAGNGHHRTYPWSEQQPTHPFADFAKDTLSVVGEHPAGVAACGAHNLLGSVWEITSSSYADYPTKSHIPVDDVALDTWDVPHRGGAWYTRNATYLHCLARDTDSPVGHNSPGVRVVLSLRESTITAT